MRLFATLFVILFASAQLLAETTVEICPSDTVQNSQQTVTTLNRQQSTTLNVYVTDNEIHVSDVPDGSTLHIYSITGARVGSFTVRDNKVILNGNLAKGIYIIRVNNRATKITVR